MNYDRMKARPISGEHCRFCGDKNKPLLITPCCGNYICCDTNYLSINGGGRCQNQHERYSICYSHYSDEHGQKWQDCKKCLEFWGQEEFEYSHRDNINMPEF